MNLLTLSINQARKIILHAAGLAKIGQFGKGPNAVLKFLDQVGFAQIDTIYVVERAHHHLFFSRVPDYKQEWLEQLQADGKIFEFWTYASGFIPMRDFRFSLPVKEAFRARRKPLTQAEVNLMQRILDRIGREGPLMASDFENDRIKKSSGWWDWRPSKVALEHLHLEGRLMTTRKKNFLKVYDLTENVIPSSIDSSRPSNEEFEEYIIIRSLQALGIASVKDISFRSRYVKNKNSIKKTLLELVGRGKIANVKVQGIAEALYMLPDYENRKIHLSGDVFVLSPFDLVNVLRHRLKMFFDFDYQVECFVPQPKRKYGYFSLPILMGDTFVARMDSKAERKQKVLFILNLHFEPTKLTLSNLGKVSKAILNFAKFNNCDAVIIKKTNDRRVIKLL
ncbi:MAG TPA: crosslink repair DNA glycosylase YcaQ family protein [Cyclobacteriaceae bacterium]|nr:crosslink repair DNA glycosylase YcaQ family protein [Cyclobacteriaceae bacterium]